MENGPLVLFQPSLRKGTNYDLLNLPEIKPPPPQKLHLREEIKITKAHKKETLRELVSIVANKWLPCRGPDEIITPIDKVAAVRNCITSIINKEICAHKEEKLKTKYMSVFGPVPHFDDLPTDVEACIKLIDPLKTIKTRSYPCPRKFKDAWGTLIDQHLKAGIIRPSSSQYASSVFIIPKADTMVLP